MFKLIMVIFFRGEIILSPPNLYKNKFFAAFAKNLELDRCRQIVIPNFVNNRVNCIQGAHFRDLDGCAKGISAAGILEIIELGPGF